MTPAAENGDREHARWREELAGYALGSLDGAEAVALEAHLAGCDQCRAELRWLQPAVGALAASVPQLDPPRGMRRRTLAGARVEPEAGGPAAERPPRQRLPWARPAIAGGAALVIALAVGAGYLAGDSGPEATTVVARAADDAIGSRGVIESDGHDATLEVAGLPPLAPDDVYQAWLRHGTELRPSTTFIVDRDGAGAVAIPGVNGAEELLVTREPRGGSRVPSTAPVIRAPLGSS